MILAEEQSRRLGEGVRQRHVARGWPIGSRGSSSSYYDAVKGRPVLLTVLPKWDARMEWVPGSAEGLALRGERPTPLEEVPARLRRAVEDRCAERGQDPAAVVPEGTWAAIAPEEVLDGRLPGVADLPALGRALCGNLPPATVQALLDLDAAMGWVPRSAERVAREGREPTPVEAPTRVVVELGHPGVTAELGEWYAVSGAATSAAPSMTPEERGRMTAVLRSMLDDWAERRGR